MILVTNAFTGYTDSSGSFDFTGGGWKAIANVPPLTVFGGFTSMAYDPALGGLVGLARPYMNETLTTWVFSEASWQPIYPPGFPQFSEALAYDPADSYLIMPGWATTLNLTGPAMPPVTWILANVSLGPPPEAMLQVTPSTILNGSSVTLTGSFQGGFGALTYLISTNASGCPSSVNSESLICTPLSAGTYSASFTVLDAAGRLSNVEADFSVIAPGISVVPSLGPRGSSVTVSGTGFQPSSALTALVFDGVPISLCPGGGSLNTSSAGSFTCTFTVPNGTSGTEVLAKAADGGSATGKFVVTSSGVPQPTTPSISVNWVPYVLTAGIAVVTIGFVAAVATRVARSRPPQ
jgi:hypothetical protein